MISADQASYLTNHVKQEVYTEDSKFHDLEVMINKEAMKGGDYLILNMIKFSDSEFFELKEKLYKLGYKCMGGKEFFTICWF